MEPARLSLNNPAFAGRLRQPSRSLAYVHRPTPEPARVIQDVALKPLPQSPAKQTSQPLNPVKIFRRANQMPQPVVRTAPEKVVTPQPVRAAAKPVARHRVQRSSLLTRVGLQPPRITKKSHKRSKQTMLLYAMASVVFIVGVAVSLNGLRANRQVSAQVKQLSSQNTAATSTATKTTTKTAPPSTTPPSAASIANYHVGPTMPRYIDITKLGVHARILSLGETSSGALATPTNVFDTGWYNGSALPGQPGSMLIDGHISSWTTKGVFYGLNKLVNGDAITITRGDGKTYTYTVVKTEIVASSAVDMSSLLVSQDTSKPGLSLISCSGDVIPGTNEFNKRIVIYAVES